MFKTSRLTFSSLLASAAMIVLAGVSGTAKADAIIGNAEFCVDATHFRFLVDVSEPLIGDINHTAVVMAFRIGADAAVFASPDLERITVNFELDTGTVTVGPLVETFGAPLNRWLNEDPINDFTLTQLGGGAYRIEGSVPHGTQPFVAGDSVFQVAQRELNSHNGALTAFLPAVIIGSCDNQIGENVTFGVGVILGTGIVIENDAIIGDFTEISDEVFIGERVVIGPNSFLGTKTEIDDDAIIGAGCKINSILNTIFHPATVAKEAQIGARCDLAGGTEVGRGAIIGDDFTTTSDFTDPILHTNLSAVTIRRGATIGNDVFLDKGTVVARGVTLGDGVGTTTVVNHIFHPVTFDRNATVRAGSQFGGGTSVKQQASVGADVTVEDEVFIGPNATIGDGAILRNDVRVLPGAEVLPGAVVPIGETVFPPDPI